MRKLFIGFLTLMVWQSLSVANTNDDIEQLKSRVEQYAKPLSQSEIMSLKSMANANQLKQHTLIERLMNEANKGRAQNKSIQKADGAILFVSFSMPKSLLFSLADEASQFDIPLVLNGLVDNDFKKTIETFSNLNREAKKEHRHFQGVSIDPIWFQQFDIKSVPALVVTKRPDTCAPETLCPNQLFDVVYGNASIKHSLKLIETKGDAAPLVAKKILEKAYV